MKKLLLFVGVIVAGLLIYKVGLAFGGLILVAAALCLILVKHYFDRSAILKRYATRYENIYVVSRHPDTGEEHSFKSDLSGLIVWADFPDVIMTVRKEEDLLRKSGNTFFNDPDLKEDQRLKVIPIIFRDGEFINESWKDFRPRIRETIEADRVIVHSTLKKENPVWYLQFANGQNGVQWERN